MKSRKVLLSLFAISSYLLFACLVSILFSQIFDNIFIGFVVLIVLNAIMSITFAFFFLIYDFKHTKLKCKHCGKIFRPTKKALFFSYRSFVKVYAKCSECNKKGMCEIQDLTTSELEEK